MALGVDVLEDEMIIQKDWEIQYIRVKADKELGYKHGELVRIAGKRINFEGFEDFEFFIDCRPHFSPQPWAETDMPDLYEFLWHVTELKSGFLVCKPQHIEEEAIKEARLILEKQGRQKLENAIAKALTGVAQ